MTKKKQLEDLFAQWQKDHQFEIFCPDGIVNGEQFGKTIPGVVFLLKDANVSTKEESNVADNLLATAKGEAPFGKMWKVLCMWAMLIENPKLTFSDCCNSKFEVEDSIRSHLNRIAVVNVCKEHGKGTNTQKEIDAKIAIAVSKYYDSVKEEIDIIAPGLVVCCGTYPFVEGQYDSKSKTLPSGAKYFFHKGIPYLEMMHPASRTGYREMFAYFKEVYSAFPLNPDKD